MFNRISVKKYLGSPIFGEDEEKTRLAGLLNTILLVLLTLIVIYTSFAPFLYSELCLVFLLNTGTALLGLGGLFLIRLGYVHFTARLLPVMLWLVITLSTFIYGGVSSASFSAYVIVILVAGLLLGEQAGLLFTFISVLTATLILLSDLSYPSSAPVDATSPVVVFSVEVLILVLSGMLLYLVTRSMNDALAQTRRNEQALVDSNRELAARTRELKRQKETVKASEERFRAIFYNAPLGIGLLDTNGRYIQINDRWAEMLGYHPEEVYQATYLDVSHPADVTISRNRLEALLEGEVETYRLEKRFVRKDGTTFWGDLSEFPLRNEAGRLEALIGMVADISDRKRIEQDLQLFKAIVETSHEAIAVCDSEGQLIYVNPAHEKLFGRSLEEARHLNYRHYYPPESVEVLNREVAPALARGETWEGVLDVFDSGGRRFPLWERADSIRDADGTLLFGIGLMHDVTEEVQVKKALRESERRYRALFEGAGDAIFLIHDGRFVDCNSKALQMFGCPREEIIGVAAHDLSPPYQPDGRASAEKGQEKVAAALKGETVIFEWQYRRCNDGTLFNTEVTLTSFTLAGERHILAIGRDITRRKQAADEREQFTLQLSTAAEIAGQVSAILDPDILVNTVIRLVKERFNLYYVHLYLLDADSRMLKLKAGYGRPGRAMLAQGHTIPLEQEQSLVARAARTGEVVYVPVVAGNHNFLPNPLLPDTRSEVAVPLVVGGQVLGVFDIQHNEINYFSQAYLDVFRTLAGQIAIALQNATFVEQIEWSLTETRVRYQVSQALAGTQTEAEVLDTLIQEAGLYSEARVSIQLLDPEAEEQVFVVYRSAAFESGLVGGVEGSRYSVSQFPLLGILSPFEPFVSSNLELDERLDPFTQEFARQKGYVSIAIVPLTAGAEWLGAIVALSSQPDYFDQRKLNLYQALADQGGMALQSARLRDSLQESEAKYSAVVEQATDGVVIIRDGLLKFTNRTMATILGYGGPNQMQYAPFTDYVAPESRPLITSRIKARLQGRDVPSIYEAKFLRKDGTVVEVEISAGIIQYQGKPANLGIIRDVTERKKTEQEIRLRNRELSLLNRVIAASVSSSGPLELLETTCRELAQAFEVPHVAASLLNEDKTKATIVAEYMSEGQPSTLNQIFSTVEDRSFQHLFSYKSPLIISDIRNEPRLASVQDMLQERGILSLISIPLLVQNQVVGSLEIGDFRPRTFSSEEINLTWSVADQIAGALARLRLNQERRQLSAAIEQTADSVLITDTEGTILYVNPAFEQISGYTRSEAVGQTPKILNSGKQDAAFYRDLWETILAGHVWHGRFVNRKKDGSLYTEEATITPVRDEHGEIVNYVSVQRDVTRELELEEQYRQAQKMEAVGQLAAGIAHDFNNLLTAINGFTELMQNLLSPDDPMRDLTGKVLNTGQRATDLVRQLLTFSRRQVAEPQLVNLNTVVNNMYQMLQPLIGDHIELEVILDPNLWSVKADPSQMEQVIANLAINARDAMPEGGQLTIETTNVVLDEGYAIDHLNAKAGQYVMLTVSDTGVGMSEEVKRRIFEPFFTTKEDGKGTGLGLATVFGIVQQSRGHVWVYSELNQGTTFKIYLPHESETPLPSFSSELDTPLPRGTETVLLVEDEPVVRDLTAQALRQQGYTVLTAADGQKAWAMLHDLDQKIHLLLTDLVMPKVSGKVLAEQLRLRYPDLKVIFTSGYTNHTATHHANLESGAVFIQKPFSPAALARKVREVLDSEQ